jgi:hypothetical protein
MVTGSYNTLMPRQYANRCCAGQLRRVVGSYFLSAALWLVPRLELGTDAILQIAACAKWGRGAAAGSVGEEVMEQKLRTWSSATCSANFRMSLDNFRTGPQFLYSFNFQRFWWPVLRVEQKPAVDEGM